MSQPSSFAIVLTLLLGSVLHSVSNEQTSVGSSAPNRAPHRLTPAQWREDLQFAVDAFLERDRSFSPKARQQFRDAIAHLQRTVEAKSDQQIVVELAKALAISKNAHTRLYLLRNRSELRRYPIRYFSGRDPALEAVKRGSH